jgi:hypothetical protein
MRAKTTTQHHDHNGRSTANEEDKHDGIGSASKQSTVEQQRLSISQHDHSGDKHPPSLQGGQASTEQNNHDGKEPASKPQNSDGKASAETTTTNRKQDDRAAKHPPRPRQPR